MLEMFLKILRRHFTLVSFVFWKQYFRSVFLWRTLSVMRDWLSTWTSHRSSDGTSSAFTPRADGFPRPRVPFTPATRGEPLRKPSGTLIPVSKYFLFSLSPHYLYDLIIWVTPPYFTPQCLLSVNKPIITQCIVLLYPANCPNGGLGGMNLNSSLWLLFLRLKFPVLLIL